MRLPLAAFLLLVLLPCLATAGPYEDAQTAWNAGDYQTTLKLLRPLADGGNAKAEFALGVLYEHGSGTEQDYPAAVKWYRLAADQGHAQAQEFLGLMYFNGLGIPKDDAEAMKWWRRAAGQGDAESQRRLGWMYANGRGVTQDYTEAFFWSMLGGGVAIIHDANQHLTPEQIAAVNKRVQDWKPVAEPAPAPAIATPETKK